MRVTRKSHLFFAFASGLSVVVVTVATTVIIIIKIKKMSIQQCCHTTEQGGMANNEKHREVKPTTVLKKELNMLNIYICM